MSNNGQIYHKALTEIEKHPYTVEVDEIVVRTLKEFSQLGISVEEKRSILLAMERELGGGIQQGHWYTCRCGYVYSVANCGAFNQSSKCPKCRNVIGTGSNNTFIESNFWQTATNSRE